MGISNARGGKLKRKWKVLTLIIDSTFHLFVDVECSACLTGFFLVDHLFFVDIICVSFVSMIWIEYFDTEGRKVQIFKALLNMDSWAVRVNEEPQGGFYYIKGKWVLRSICLTMDDFSAIVGVVEDYLAAMPPPKDFRPSKDL